ncbi:Maturation and nuclear export of 40S ribosomal subunits interacting protein, partial [Coemansia sp. RSA 2399]
MYAQEEAQALADQVHQWESAVLQSQQNLNNIVDIFNVAKVQGCVETSFAAINSLGRIYSALWTKGLLSRNKDSDDAAQEKVGDWLRSNYTMYTELLRGMLGSKEAPLQVGALRLLVQMLQKEGHGIQQTTNVYS